MNISNLFGSGLSSAWKSPFSSSAPASESVKELSPLALAVQRADKRVQTEVDANTAQLSSFGRLKASVSDVQIAAKAVVDASAETGGASLERAAQGLVAAFNAAASTAQSTAALPGANEASDSARRVALDLNRAVTGDAGIAGALRGVGITFDGHALQLEVSTLGASLQKDPVRAHAVLAELGQQLYTTSSAELQGNGNVNGSLSALTQLAKVLESKQAALQSAAQATSAAPSGWTNGNRIAAYQAAMTHI